ncbi:MAG: hypothetical protein M4579_002700 [Chaenotheca gracillima]|nr:MAG: hypothetical protein M4579_002700 [Chaenotheca gracillima]
MSASKSTKGDGCGQSESLKKVAPRTSIMKSEPQSPSPPSAHKEMPRMSIFRPGGRFVDLLDSDEQSPKAAGLEMTGTEKKSSETTGPKTTGSGIKTEIKDEESKNVSTNAPKTPIMKPQPEYPSPPWAPKFTAPTRLPNGYGVARHSVALPDLTPDSEDELENTKLPSPCFPLGGIPADRKFSKEEMIACEEFLSLSIVALPSGAHETDTNDERSESEVPTLNEHDFESPYDADGDSAEIIFLPTPPSGSDKTAPNGNSSVFGDASASAHRFDFRPQRRVGGVFEPAATIPCFGMPKATPESHPREPIKGDNRKSSSNSSEAFSSMGGQNLFAPSWASAQTAGKVLPHLYHGIPGIPFQLPVTVLLVICDALEESIVQDQRKKQFHPLSGGNKTSRKRTRASEDCADLEAALLCRHKLGRGLSAFSVTPEMVKAVRIWWAAKRDW